MLKLNFAPFRDHSGIWVCMAFDKNSFPCLRCYFYPCPQLTFQLWDLTHLSFHPLIESIFSPVITLLQFPWLLVFLLVGTKAREQMLPTVFKAREEEEAQGSLSLAIIFIGMSQWWQLCQLSQPVNIMWKEHEMTMRAVCGGQSVCFTPTAVLSSAGFDVQLLWPLEPAASDIWLLLTG